MKIILNDHIEHLGERGESVAVKPGYANNYLLPKGLAYPDTPGNRKRFEQEQTKWEEMDLSRQSAAQKLAAELEGTKLSFERRAGENDVLFGSVTVVEIGRELAERGFDIDRRRIMLESPIKALGNTDVVIHIHRGIDVTIPVRVVRPGEDPNAVAPEFVAEGVLETEEAAIRDPCRTKPPLRLSRRSRQDRSPSSPMSGDDRAASAGPPHEDGPAREPSSKVDEGSCTADTLGHQPPNQQCRGAKRGSRGGGRVPARCDRVGDPDPSGRALGGARCAALRG